MIRNTENFLVTSWFRNTAFPYKSQQGDSKQNGVFKWAATALLAPQLARGVSSISLSAPLALADKSLYFPFSFTTSHNLNHQRKISVIDHDIKLNIKRWGIRVSYHSRLPRHVKLLHVVLSLSLFQWKAHFWCDVPFLRASWEVMCCCLLWYLQNNR